MNDPDDKDEDAWLEPFLDRALAPYEGVLSDVALAAMREEIRWFLLTDPELSRFARRVKPRSAPEQSGTVGEVTEELPIARVAQGAKKR